MKSLPERINDLAAMIMERDEPYVLRRALDDLARSADTAELLLRIDYPDEASSLREKIALAKYLLGEPTGRKAG